MSGTRFASCKPYWLIAAAVLCICSTSFATISFTNNVLTYSSPSDLSSTIDPAGLYTVANSYGVSKASFQALNPQVVAFNGAPAPGTPLNSMAINYTSTDTVTFTFVTSYNYGTYTSYGRGGFSGSSYQDAISTSPNTVGGITDWLDASISSTGGRGVEALGFCVCFRSDQAVPAGQAVFTHNDGTSGTVTLPALGGAGNPQYVFIGYQAPAGKTITRVQASRASAVGGAWVTVDDWSFVMSPPPVTTGTGLQGEYFNNMDFTSLALTRTDATVDFDWGIYSPDASVGYDTFSVRWTGQVQAQYSETYTFYTVSDDGVRLWVNGQQIINNWTDHGPTENSGTIALTAGVKYNITMEYYENTSGAVAKLLWSSASTPKAAIPQAQLFPPGGGGGTTNGATFVTQNVPSSMTVGQNYVVSVTMHNSGTTTWTEAAGYRLGSQNGENNTTWGMHRAYLGGGESIAPGQDKTFSWTVTAPTTPGTYNFQWRMVRENVEWFGDFTTNVAVTVTGGGTTNSATFVSQSVPSSMTAGQNYVVSVTMHNSGNTTWTEAAGYRLGSQNAQDNTTWGMSRALLGGGESIAPGQDKTFSWTVTAPTTPGTYNFQWKMVREQVEWFGALTTNVAVTVSAGGGTVWNVSTASQLQNAVASYTAGDTISIANGTYYPTYRLICSRGAVTIRGASGNRDSVIIQGPGMLVNAEPVEMFDVACDNVTIQDLTIRGVWAQGIHVRGENDCDNPTFRNLKIIDCGERFIKGSANLGDINAVVDNLLVENCYFEQITPLSGHSDNNYIAGMDMMTLNNPVIRDCTFKNIRGATGGGRGGVFLWLGINNPTVERNTFIGCDRGICIGNPAAPAGVYMPNYHSTGGILRNNVVVRGADIAMELCYTNNLKVYYNSVYSADTSYYRAVHIYDTSARTVNLQLSYNIIRGQIYRNYTGQVIETGNITGSTPATNWFVDPSNGNLHLTASATPAFNMGVLLPEVPTDFDGANRSSSPDIGADEY